MNRVAENKTSAITNYNVCAKVQLKIDSESKKITFCLRLSVQ